MKKVLLIVALVISLGVVGTMFGGYASAQFFRVPVGGACCAPVFCAPRCVPACVPCCVPVCAPVCAPMCVPVACKPAKKAAKPAEPKAAKEKKEKKEKK